MRKDAGAPYTGNVVFGRVPSLGLALSVLSVAPMKFRPITFRTFIIPLAVAAGLVLVLGVGLLGGLALRTPLYLLDRGGQAVPQAVQFVPKQSPWMASVLTRPDRLAQLWDYLATPKQRPSLRADRDRLERAVLAQTGLTYERDLRPWLGEEITVALVSPDLDLDPANGRRPGYLAVLSCRDVDKARATLELFWQNRALAGEPLTFEDLGGTRLIYGRSAARSGHGFSTFATAMVANRFLLVANDPMVLRQAIAAAQSVGDNVATDWRYKLALKTLSGPRVGLLAVNLPQIQQWLHPTPTTTLATLEATEHLPLTWGLISLGLQRQGVLAEAAWVAASGQPLEPHREAIEDWYALARYLPGSLGLEAMGHDLDRLGDHLLPWLAPWVEQGVNGIALLDTVDEQLGNGVTHQLLETVDQPYALGLGLSPTNGLPDWLLVSPTHPSTQQMIETLGRMAPDRGFSLGQLEILGFPTTVWTRLSLSQSRPGALQVQTEVAGLTAQVGHHQVLTTSPVLMEQALRVEQQQGQPPIWTDQLGRFPRLGESYVHLDWPTAAAYVRQQSPQFRLWETVAKPALKHLKGVILTSYGQTDRVRHEGLLIQLQNS
ncbi:hypothetical protein GFS31_15130 [Leptolyngbya sp. BL0902]|uniref:DUF3352 domain-containing protein n=1 Tax=Leptolyngbya sp. BL0902 TaxID=1115757 RepID=UPI0018E8F6E1|nr:DUF3352 domain-containing protein [Leptolyngbya sp. BL0902]QQE64830.1 hypothetical protein GFS31_15130 [Leptolyngbya sp. BL0902]